MKSKFFKHLKMIFVGLLIVGVKPMIVTTMADTNTPISTRIPATVTKLNPSTVRSKIVLVGDVHGYLEGLQDILRHAGIITENDDWNGGDTVLIQTGDVIDRCDKSEEVYRLLTKLQKQAEKAGGKVVRLLGNHELLLLQKNYEISNLMDKEGLRNRMIDDIKNNKLQAAYALGNRLVTHAGLTIGIQTMLSVDDKGEIINLALEQLADKINQILKDSVEINDFNSDAIYAVGKTRSRGEDARIAGPFWADYHGDLLTEKALGVKQIIGHTPHNEITYTDNLDLIDIDAGLCYDKLDGIETRFYLLIENNEIKIVQKNPDTRKIKNLWKIKALGEFILDEYC